MAEGEKEHAVKEWPTLSSRKQVQWFLGFANFYGKFICNFSSVAAPLNKLTEDEIPVEPSDRECLEEVKGQFHFSFTDFGIGAVLSQRDP